MENKISDFKIAEAVLRQICRKMGVYFVDLSVGMTPGDPSPINVSGSKNISHTIYKIVSDYLSNFSSIVGAPLKFSEEQKENFLLVFANKLRQFIYKNNRFYSPVDKPHMLYLYQKTLIWILMKDLICPIFDKDIKNIKIVCGEDPYMDIARYYEENECPCSNNKNYEFIFINNIDNVVAQNALLFIEVLRSHELSPIEVMTRIYQSDLYEKYRGLLAMALDEDDADVFEALVIEALGVDLSDLLPTDKLSSLSSRKSVIKCAQGVGSGATTPWWNFGLLEQMMEPVRGSDWTVYKDLQPYVESFWNVVEDVRKERIKKGHDSGVPFDVLLRIKQKQNVDSEIDPTLTLQALLASDRIW
jgi:hypothetical protein